MWHRILSKRASVVAAALVLTAPRSPAAQLAMQHGLIEPNVATEKELLAVPHFTASIAKAIASGADNAPFLSIISLDSALAKYLTKEQRAEVYGKMFVHVNLNDGTDAEMLLIPGVTPRLVGELKAHRPWTSFAQFEREIGKSLDKAAVARLEQYFFIPIELNSATDEAMLTIPGVGSRWLREFKEYRPYGSIFEFRREIGKYDRKAESRFERYVTVATK